jgi:hypothetical protein
MEASPITVAVIHTPYWNLSDVGCLRNGSHNVLIPALLYLRASDIEKTPSSPPTSHRSRERKRKCTQRNHRHSAEKHLYQSSHDSDTEHSNPSPCSVGSNDSSGQNDRDPSNILYKLNTTDHERLLINDLDNERRHDEYYCSAPSTSGYTPASKKRRRHDDDVSRARERKSPEEEKDEYERWVIGSWDNLFSRASIYPE